jgi:flagellar motor switch protein FliN
MPDEIKQDVVAEEQSQAEASDAEAVDAAAAETPAQENAQSEQPSAEAGQEVADDAGGAEAHDEAGGAGGMESRQDLEDEFPDLSSVKVEETMAHQAEFQQLSVSASDRRAPGNIDLLMDVKMPIAIELGRTEMAISEILTLGPGSVVELDKLAGEPVDLLVNNKVVARGEVVVVDENFGVRITMLMSPQERLKSLAQ